MLKQSCPLMVTFGTKRKKIVLLEALIRTKVDRMLTVPEMMMLMSMICTKRLV